MQHKKSDCQKQTTGQVQGSMGRLLGDNDHLLGAPVSWNSRAGRSCLAGGDGRG